MKEPRISRYVNLKTRCQASPFATDELNRLIQWPTAVRPWPPRGGETAERRLCSAPPGHDTPERTFITPAPARTQPHSVFTLPRPFFLAAAAAELSQLRRRHSQHQLALAASPPLQRLH